MPAALAQEELLHDHPLTHRPTTQTANTARATAHAAMPHTAREYWEEMREEAHPHIVPKTRRRLRRVHREFRVSFTTGVCCAVLFGQLLWMIYVKSVASTASVQSHELGLRIAAIQDDIARAQKKNSRTTSTAQLDTWSKQLGLRPVTQADIDPVSADTRPDDVGVSEAGN